MPKVLSYALLILSFSVTNLRAQDTVTYPTRLKEWGGRIAGLIRFESSSLPVPHATVRVANTVMYGITGADGLFSISGLPNGRYTITVTCPDCEVLTVEAVNVRFADSTLLDLRVKSRGATANDLLVSTSGRTVTPAPQGPVPLIVMPAQSLSLRHAQTLERALAEVTGVNIVGDQIDVRGAGGLRVGGGGRVILLVDGMPRMSADDNSTRLGGIPVNAADRIEILKGASSSLYGPGGINGVINIITQAPEKDSRVDLQAYGGFFTEGPALDSAAISPHRAGTNRYVGIDGRWTKKTGPMGILMTGTYRRDDGSEGFGRNRFDLYGKILWQLDPHTDLNFIGSFFEDDNDGSFGRIVYDTAMYRNPLASPLSFSDANASFAVQMRRFTDPNFSYLLQMGIYHTEFDDNSAGEDSTRARSSADNAFAEIQLVSTVNPNVRFDYGLSIRFEDVLSTIFGEHNLRRVGLYGQCEFGNRSEIITDIGGRMDVTAVLDSGIDATVEFSPRIAVIYFPSTTTSLRLVASRGFRPPSIAERFISSGYGTGIIYNDTAGRLGLESERSWHGEIGASHQIRLERASLNIDVTLFADEYYGLIEPLLESTGALRHLRFANLTRARVLGGDLECVGVFPDLGLTGRVGLSSFSGTDVRSSTTLNERLSVSGYMSATWNSGPLTLAADYRFIPRLSTITPATLAVVPSIESRSDVNAIDLHARYDVTRSFGTPSALWLHARNLLQSAVIDGTGNRDLMRNIELGISVTLH